MKEKIKTICFIVITLALLSLAIGQTYKVWYKYTGDPIERCKDRCGSNGSCVGVCVRQMVGGTSEQ